MLFLGCGTTHHFLPPAPLERGEWQVQLYWHYDLGGVRLPVETAWPELNAYVGTEKELNLGFGLQFPFFVQHATASRAFESGDRDTWQWYATINRPLILAASNNPSFEIGAMYSKIDQGIHQDITLAIATGAVPIWQPRDDSNGFRLPGSIYKLFPVVKYAVSGRDVGLSWVHYHGVDQASVEMLREAVISSNDTLLVLDAGQITSISTSDEIHHGYPAPLMITLVGDSVITFTGWRLYPDQIARPPEANLMKWIGEKYFVYVHENRTVVISPSELREAWHQGSQVVITRYPNSLLSRFNAWRSFLDDNSFALGIFFH